MMKCKDKGTKKIGRESSKEFILRRGSATSYRMTGEIMLCLECQASNPVGNLAWPGVPGSLRKTGATDENIPANVGRREDFIGKCNCLVESRQSDWSLAPYTGGRGGPLRRRMACPAVGIPTSLPVR
jgi:hypothetical protein